VAYHLAVVVDDAQQGVNAVTRGNDLFEAVHIQLLLQALLGLPTPTYHHHRLVLRPDGKRFAKRDQTETLADLRARGVTAKALRAELGVAWKPKTGQSRWTPSVDAAGEIPAACGPAVGLTTP
jgi:glutamyl-Q tRNA(Asp) synthetase